VDLVMVIVIHLRQVDHVVDAGNVDNNLVFDDIVKRHQQYQREQCHQNLFSFAVIVVVVVSNYTIENEKRS